MAKTTYMGRTFRKLWAASVLLSMLPVAGSISNVFAHGGEDHGEQKVVAKTQNGMVLRSARVGDLEVLLKHPALKPDTSTSARLFMTHFATNEPASGAEVTAEIESTNGAVTSIPIEKTDVAGSYLVAVPALADGHYTFRAMVRINGKTETATLSDISVEHETPAAAGASSSWSQTILMMVLFLVGAALFSALIFLAIRSVKSRPVTEEAAA